MAGLFLSYAHQDIRSAEKLAGLLEANGLTVWWDRRMVPGDKIHDVIDEQIESAKAVIVLWSSISVKSDWVRGEAQTAHELKKLVPIKIEECKLPINYRGIHTPEVYKKAELHKLAQILTDKFKQPVAQGTVPGPTAKIEFTDRSATNFVAELARQRSLYEKELAELEQDHKDNIWVRVAKEEVPGIKKILLPPGTSRLIKKNPLGASVSIAGATASVGWWILSTIFWLGVAAVGGLHCSSLRKRTYVPLFWLEPG